MSLWSNFTLVKFQFCQIFNINLIKRQFSSFLILCICAMIDISCNSKSLFLKSSLSKPKRFVSTHTRLKLQFKTLCKYHFRNESKKRVGRSEWNSDCVAPSIKESDTWRRWKKRSELINMSFPSILNIYKHSMLSAVGCEWIHVCNVIHNPMKFFFSVLFLALSSNMNSNK